MIMKYKYASSIAHVSDSEFNYTAKTAGDCCSRIGIKWMSSALILSFDVDLIGIRTGTKTQINK